MTQNLLILGGTTEATALAAAVQNAGLQATFSYAGRVANPKRQPLPTRTGGFGGVAGLVAYIREATITHIVDATHPFAAQMSHNAVAACAETGTRLIALSRPAWQEKSGDRWAHVPDMQGAVAALNVPAQNVFLAIGRMHLDAFAAQPQHRYILRLVDAPDPAVPLPLPRAHVIVDQGPFDIAADSALLRDHAIDLVVSKNAGGSGAQAKIDAARDLDIPVLMIDRPMMLARPQAETVAQVLDWLAHCDPDFATERGV